MADVDRRRSIRARNDHDETVRIDGASRHPVRSPLWWVNRLYNRLIDRSATMNVYDDYYRGEFPLPWLAPQAEEEFRRILKMSRANYCGLIVDSMVERMAVEGFRVDDGKDYDRARKEAAKAPQPGPLGLPSQQITGALGAAAQGKSISPQRLAEGEAHGVTPEGKIPVGPAPVGPGSLGTTKSANFTGMSLGEADRETWRIWQKNRMDTLFDQALLESAINGVSYLMIAPNDEDPKTPYIWVEHPSQCIIEHEPGTQRQVTAAGLKVWDDDINNVTCATLYLPGEIHKFQARRRSDAAMIRNWEPRIVEGEEWPANTELDYVPIFELPNNPRLLTGGRSEIEDVLDSQDRCVKTIADRLMTQDYGAFPQRWARGWPEEDSQGRPTPPIDVGRDRMITTDVTEAQFGQFAAADLGGYMLAKKEDVTDMAARTRTPAQYLLGEFSNVNGETLKASESGLVAKVRQRIRGVDDELERAILKVREMAGLESGDRVTVEIVWRNPEFKTEGELVDSLQKMSALHVPDQALWERWGATPPEIERWGLMQQQQQQQAAEQDAMTLLADTYRTASAERPAPAKPNVPKPVPSDGD